MAKDCTSQTLIRMQLQTGVVEVCYLIVCAETCTESCTQSFTNKHKLTDSNNLFANTKHVITYIAYLIFSH